MNNASQILYNLIVTKYKKKQKKYQQPKAKSKQTNEKTPHNKTTTTKNRYQTAVYLIAFTWVALVDQNIFEGMDLKLSNILDKIRLL